MNDNFGIYKIVNLVNGKFYIGSTSTLGFQRRWRCHRNQLRINKHRNQHLQYAWNKYGEDNFKFEIIEKCLPKKCVVREQYYFNTLHPQYNILTVAGSVKGYRHTPSAKALIGAASAGKNHSSYSGEHVFYNPSQGVFEGSIVDFAIKFNFIKALPYKLTRGVLCKSHGWVYVGKRTEKCPYNLDSFYQRRIFNDKPLHSFVHENGSIFNGTQAEFVRKYNLDRSTICKLINGKRTFAFGWNIKT